ncbi:hypothetical protein AAC387_Pa05g1476 [Persea americana]
MYANCGSMENAVSHFLGSPRYDVVLWNSLLVGHTHHGNGLELLKAFDEMQIHGVNLDHVTFLTVLSCCSLSGLVDRVYRYFLLTHDEYGIIPMKEHYACVADALGHARWDEAKKVREVMERKPLKEKMVGKSWIESKA